ncbi:unnamed protein product [Sphacelaria rigidula]
MSTFIGCKSTEGLSESDEVLLDSVLEWYNEDMVRVEAFLSIVKRKNGMSLRVIDWLVTNYSKTKSVVLETGGVPRDLNRDYQKNLSAYNKRNMDPFARKNKISITILGKEVRSSTVGQLNFFRWFLKNGVNFFLEENKGVVEDHMKAAESTSKKGKHCRAKNPKYNTKTYSGKFKMVF